MLAGRAFAPLRAALENAGIRYAIGGSWASTAFGEPRFTHDVDIVAELTQENLNRLFDELPRDFYGDPQEARNALRLGRPFNLIYIPLAFKFDLFPTRAFPLGKEELDRAVYWEGSGLSDLPTPFVSPEDILLAKLHWYRSGGELSEVQWRDIHGIVRGRGPTLDRNYLKHGASRLGVTDLLKRALGDVSPGA